VDGSVIMVVVIGAVALLALVVFVRGTLNFIREGRDQGGTKALNDASEVVKSAARTVKEPVNEPEVAAAKESEATTTVVPEKPVKKVDWPPVRMQGPREEDDERIARIQRIVTRHLR
jgi:hypothetical protein